jgi:hypothetical protein
MDGVDLVVEMAERHVRLLGELVDQAQLVSDDDLDRAGLRTSVSGLIDQLEALSDAFRAGDAVALDPRTSVMAMRRRLDRVGPAFVDDVSKLAATGRFDETVVDAFSPSPQAQSYGAMVADVLTDGSHQRLLALATLADLVD